MDGADVNAADGNDETPLFCTASRGHKKIVELLLDNDANIKAGSFYGTALHGAAETDIWS
jgi:ankyrin repeat protein